MAGHIDTTEAVKRLQVLGHKCNEERQTDWLFVPRLGIAWREPAGPGAKMFVYQEVRSRLVRHQSLLGFIPASGAQQLGGQVAHLLQPTRLAGPLCGSTDSVLVLGHSRTKLLDYEARTATAIHGADSKAIGHELAARRMSGANSTTRLLEADRQAGILVEQLELGFNLAIYVATSRLVSQVADLLCRWRAGRFREVPSETHLRNIEKDLDEATRESAEWRRLRTDLASECTVAVELSHGDLQPANVLLTPDGMRLVDFERLNWRVSGYDLATFDSGRSPRISPFQGWLAAELLRSRSTTKPQVQRQRKDQIANTSAEATIARRVPPAGIRCWHRPWVLRR